MFVSKAFQDKLLAVLLHITKEVNLRTEVDPPWASTGAQVHTEVFALWLGRAKMIPSSG